MGGWVGVGGGGGGWVAGSIETKAISASNLKLKLKLTEAELGNIDRYSTIFCNIRRYLTIVDKILSLPNNPTQLTILF